VVILHCQAHGKVVDFLEFLAGAIIYARPPGHARPAVKLLKLFFYCTAYNTVLQLQLIFSCQLSLCEETASWPQGEASPSETGKPLRQLRMSFCT